MSTQNFVEITLQFDIITLKNPKTCCSNYMSNSKTKYWKVIFSDLKDDKYTLKKAKVVKSQKALCSYA